MSFYFDIDEMLVGQGCAIFVQGSRRQLVRGLGGEQMAWMRDVSKRDSFEVPTSFLSLAERLSTHHIILSGTRPATRKRLRDALRVPASIVRVASLPLIPMTHPLVAGAVLLTVLVLVMGGLLPITTQLSGRNLFENGDPVFIASSFAWLITLCVVHELGHAAACQRVTSIAGGIRLGVNGGMVVMATDVSPICLSDRSGKAAVALSGFTCQSVASVWVLLSQNSAPARFAATLSLLSAVYGLVPFPRNDGYWLIRDYFGLTLVPRLFPGPLASRWDTLYGWGLLVSTLAISAAILRAGTEPFAHATEFFRESPIRAALLYAFLVYMNVVCVQFLYRNLRSILRASICPSKQSHAT